MRDDFEIIVKKFPYEQDVLRVYAIGDVHVGSPEFNEEAIKRKIGIIEEDPYGVVCLCGDLGDFGLKNSKTNVYKATMNPHQQKRYIYELFLPIADKIVAAVPGNHEERLVREVGICPLYDLCVRWGCEDVYRENVAITKLQFGSVRGRKQQNQFIGVTSHGSTRNKHKKFVAGFEGVDFAISGHTHQMEYASHGRIFVPRQGHMAQHRAFKELVVDANLLPGGYGFKKEYEVAPPPELQYLELSAYCENNTNRTLHRVINYHSLQL